MDRYNLSIEKLQFDSEELACVHLWLDDLKVPAFDKNGEKYSTVGRINQLLVQTYYDANIDIQEIITKQT